MVNLSHSIRHLKSWEILPTTTKSTYGLSASPLSKWPKWVFLHPHFLISHLDPPNWDLKPFQLMLKLPKDPPPTLRSPQSFSKDFNDFITHCLRKDANQRPTAKQLVTVRIDHVYISYVKHPFITNNGAKGMASLKELLKSSASGVVGSSPKGNINKDERIREFSTSQKRRSKERRTSKKTSSNR